MAINCDILIKLLILNNKLEQRILRIQGVAKVQMVQCVSIFFKNNKKDTINESNCLDCYS